MLGFLAVRVLRSAATLWLVATLVFVSLRLTGDPAHALPDDGSAEQIESFRRQYALDRPIPVQYVRYVIARADGRFGDSLQLRLLPSGGRESWQHLVLPALTLATGLLARLARRTRSSLLDVVRQRYIQVAYAKGFDTRRVIVRHALRAARCRQSRPGDSAVLRVGPAKTVAVRCWTPILYACRSTSRRSR